MIHVQVMEITDENDVYVWESDVADESEIEEMRKRGLGVNVLDWGDHEDEYSA